MNQQTTSAGEDVEKENPFALLVGMQIGAATVESSMEIPQKIKNGLPFDPAILLLGIYLKEPKTLIQKNISTLCWLQHYLQSHQAMEAAQVSINRQLWDIYTMEYYSAIKKKILPLVTIWMDLENIMLSEISQSEKDKYMISLMCGI